LTLVTVVLCAVVNVNGGPGAFDPSAIGRNNSSTQGNTRLPVSGTIEFIGAFWWQFLGTCTKQLGLDPVVILFEAATTL